MSRVGLCIMGRCGSVGLGENKKEVGQMADQELNQADLNHLVQFGLSVQAIAAVIVYAARRNKLEFVQTITDHVDQFIEKLSVEERTELESEIKNMVDQKSQDFVANLNQDLGQERAAEVVKWLERQIK